MTTELEVQKFLRRGDVDWYDLNQTLGIKTTFHQELPLVILNYDQVDSPKTDPIVRECRGLVLHIHTHDVVARSFSRFFNWGEVQQEAPDFDFSDFVTQSKEDGSLCLIYWFEGQWMANTRGSFADGNINDSGITWQEAFIRSMPGISSLSELDECLDRSITYVCEFCSHWNKVVREYDRPTLFLLSTFSGTHEHSIVETDAMCPDFMVRPEVVHFDSITEIQRLIESVSVDDPTFEGFVIRDKDNRRWKVKSPTYLALHRLKGDGDNMFLPKNLVPFVLTGEASELLTYFPEVADKFHEVSEIVEWEREMMMLVWRDTQSIESQKDFAKAIIPRTTFASILFEARKRNVDPESIWRDSADLIVKRLFA